MSGYENEEDEDEELSRKLSFCIHSYRAVGSSNVSTRSLQRIRRELKENNPKEKEMREDKEDYLQHKLSIQHQMQRLEEKVKRERYNAFSARYESELRERRMLFQSRERVGKMNRPWTADSPASSPSRSPVKSPVKDASRGARGSLGDPGDRGKAKGAKKRAVTAGALEVNTVAAVRPARDESGDNKSGGESTASAPGPAPAATKDPAPAPTKKEKRKSVLNGQRKRASMIQGQAQKQVEESRPSRRQSRQQGGFSHRVRDVQGTVHLQHGGLEQQPKQRKATSARACKYRHPRTGELSQRPSSQPSGGLLNSKTVDMNFAFWGFRKKPASAGPGAGRAREGKKGAAPEHIRAQKQRLMLSSKEAMTGKLQLGSGWRPCPPAMFDVSNMSPVHGKIRAWQDQM